MNLLVILNLDENLSDSILECDVNKIELLPKNLKLNYINYGMYYVELYELHDFNGIYSPGFRTGRLPRYVPFSARSGTVGSPRYVNFNPNWLATVTILTQTKPDNFKPKINDFKPVIYPEIKQPILNLIQAIDINKIPKYILLSIKNQINTNKIHFKMNRRNLEWK